MFLACVHLLLFLVCFVLVVRDPLEEVKTHIFPSIGRPLCRDQNTQFVPHGWQDHNVVLFRESGLSFVCLY